MRRCLLAFLAVMIPGNAETSAWKAGAAKVDITPDGPVWMAGYAARTKPSEGVRQPIYAKALAIESADGKPAVLVTFDLSGVPRGLGERIAKRAASRFGVTRDRLWMNASHSHSGPVTYDYVSSRPGFKIPAGQAESAKRYTMALEDKVIDVIDRALAARAPAALSFQQGFAGFAVNRRRVTMGRQLPGPVDHDVPVLAVRKPSGELMAVVAGYSCHATVLSDYQISGDWPGYAQHELESMHPGAIALFVQNTGADANPLPRRTPELAQQFGRLLAVAVDQVLQAKMAPVAGPLTTVFETVPLAFQKSGETYPYPVEVWRFGKDLEIIALGGEVVVDYGLRLRKQHGWDKTWVAGYSNDVFGYIPSLRVLREGGYEGGEAMRYTSLPGPFAESVEDTIVGKVDELVKRVESAQ